MSNSLYWEIIARIRNYLTGNESLDDFEDWFVSRSWDVHLTHDLAAADLVAGIELRLAEFSEEHWTEEELQRFLMEKVLATVPHAEIRTSTTATTDHITTDLPERATTTEYIESLMAPA